MHILIPHQSERIHYLHEICDMIRFSYRYRPPFHIDVENLINTCGDWKLIFEDKLIAGIIYRDHFGSKIRYVFHNGTEEGKNQLKILLEKDLKSSNHWVEVSGPLEKYLLQIDVPKIRAIHVELLLNSVPDIHEDGYHYDREISKGNVKTEILMGSFKGETK